MKNTLRRGHRRGAQRGVAAVTAILIVAVAAAAASMMLAQQSAMLDQTMLVASRAQADIYAQAGLEWARGVLLQDAKTSAADSLGEGWARPIAGMPVERAVVAGDIADEQGKFNLNNLVQRAPQRARHQAAAPAPRPGGALARLADAVATGSIVTTTSPARPAARADYRASRAVPRRHAPMMQVDELYRARLRRGGGGAPAPLRDRRIRAHPIN